MEIETSGAVKLFFPKPSLTLVYFEALANALDAGATSVSIKIDISSFDTPDTLNVTITDNGTGFNDESYDRFKTLLKPRDKFHKGIGRLVFLNYFNRVHVNSCWDDKSREFIFKEGFDGEAPIVKLSKIQPNLTSLRFNGFAKDRIKSYEHLKPECLKTMIKEQFLPTLDALKRDDKNFEILLSLTTQESNKQKEFFSNDVTITKQDLPSFTKVSIQDHSLDAFSSIDML